MIKFFTSEAPRTDLAGLVVDRSLSVTSHAGYAAFVRQIRALS